MPCEDTFSLILTRFQNQKSSTERHRTHHQMLFKWQWGISVAKVKVFWLKEQLLKNQNGSNLVGLVYLKVPWNHPWWEYNCSWLSHLLLLFPNLWKLHQSITCWAKLDWSWHVVVNTWLLETLKLTVPNIIFHSNVSFVISGSGRHSGNVGHLHCEIYEDGVITTCRGLQIGFWWKTLRAIFQCSETHLHICKNRP